MGIIDFHKTFMLEACKGNLLNNEIMTCDLCWTFEDILWESSTFTKLNDTWLFMLEACKANLLNKWYHDMWLVLDIWGHFVAIINFHKIDWYMALHVGSMQSDFVEQMISWHVICVGCLRNFVRGKYGQQILCHNFEDHTRNYFATQETHEFNISHKTHKRNPTVMGLGKLVCIIHWKLSSIGMSFLYPSLSIHVSTWELRSRTQ
jgi:hypothetical protein